MQSIIKKKKKVKEEGKEKEVSGTTKVVSLFYQWAAIKEVTDWKRRSFTLKGSSH